ncbi:uncharacterized protein PAC_06724 [Phialocephala subalpina]|uniref:Peptidase A1 domain-containing protein n=1 Tax=Phialocephala subalpina TaxID=576137 RepID=A0A1L7WVP3_9HELO|nr:uncharacterized protein PAC_06724 [Phialocephala subalpina]
MKSKSSIVTLVAILLPLALSAKLSLPLLQERTKQANVKRELPALYPVNSPQAVAKHQQPLSQPYGHGNGEVFALYPGGSPIIHSNEYTYTINISLGTPPQQFRAILDLTWSDPFVSSASCDGEHCRAFLQRYNSSSSSTYERNGTEITLMYGFAEGFGVISIDTLTLGTNFTIPCLDFIELKGYSLPNHIAELSSFDSILGLAIEEHGRFAWMPCHGATLNWTALFSSTTPYIGLPWSMIQSFNNKIEWYRSECSGGLVVECDSIPDLPDLIIDFGGQNITITGEDYVERIIPTDSECQYTREECTIIVTGLPYFMDGVTPELMLFGMTFLKKVYGVFDWDEKTISFGKLRD